MEFEIFEKEKSDEKTRLAFKKCEDGIDIIAVDKEGRNRSYLISFKKDGTVVRYGSIAKSLGFKLERDDRIVFEDG